MLKRIISAGLVSVSAATAFGQTRSIDPFSIAPGSSFSASAKSRKETTATPTLRSSIASDVDEALAIIRKNYAGDGKATTETLTRSAIDSMLKSLDPHSNYYNASEFDELIGDQRSEYFGTGSTIVSYERNGTLETYVVATYPGSSSQAAGIKYGDRIVTVAGKDVSTLGSNQIRDLIRGPRGTSVSVTVDRSGTKHIFNLKRDRIPQPTVTNIFLLGNGIGYIEMPDGFSFTSYAEFNAAYAKLKSDGMTSLVIDLRGNGGGILEQSIKIAEKFLPYGATVVTQKGRSAADNRVWKSFNRDYEKLPLVVLVDGDTASASEVIAGALQDNDRALIVGEKTFGKGLVQSVLDLPGGTGLTLTTARYYTPSGRSIQRDYSHGEYDYRAHRQDLEQEQVAKVASYTVSRRKVFGGEGITPDTYAYGEKVTDERIALLDPIFYFALEMDNKTTVDDAAITRFAIFAEKGWNLSPTTVETNVAFIKQRLEINLQQARSGPSAARETELSYDQQLSSAVAAIPSAAALRQINSPQNISKK